ncbi:Cys-rich peptide radical SAM maturase CcpM [Vallitalea guaymasensis]|uniref:Cys-rich peptide radical SAM maturase CcpM n=1 Tax=Vallitalea guaymasensis TaxID=1185412 RepID=UPI0023533E9D|nr:Cys-rich peptide radical SAM maturase CcpM [Vallitalea guaymasensis]
MQNDALPFIHLFKTYENTYVFDINSNAIFKIPKYVYDDLEQYLNNKKITFSCDKSKEIIEMMMTNGLLSSHKWKYMEHPSTSIIPQYLKTSVSTLTLQVTQSCNLVCNYCPYAGSYHNRKHSSKKMSFETGKRAIDFYVKHAVDVESLNIGFYGGEPLIEFNLVKRLVEYANDTYKGKKIRYHMTTNATLLKDEIIKFLDDNNFNLLISLDGPKEIHDKNRKDSQGRGSFDRILENLKYLQKNYKDFASKINFNCVIDPSLDFDCLHKFFTDYDTVKNYYTSFNYINKQNIIEDKFNPTENYTIKYKYEIFKLFLFLIKRLDERHVSKIVKSYYSVLFSTMKERRTVSFSETEYGHHSGPCIAGSHKIFVDTEGNLFPCEKVNEQSKSFIIGNIWDGFDVEKAAKLTNIGKLTEKQCLSCWNVNFCYLCCVFSDDNGTLSANAKLTQCRNLKRDTEEMMKDYCYLKEMDFTYDDEVFRII